MGLDMYLTGERYFLKIHQRGEVKAERYELGYWRKHPNLHGCIVETFAGGEDDCRPIALGTDELKTIIKAIKNRELPETTGVFFGASDDSDEQIAEDVNILEDAIRWREADDADAWRSIYYQASW
jgi:hypothetical protein